MKNECIKKIAQRCINKFGFDLRRLNQGSNQYIQIMNSLNAIDVDLVLDVGANVGQFAEGLRKFGYRGEIVSFEPLVSAYNDLMKASSRDVMWHVHPRCAVGDYDGSVVINIAGNSVSSSILSMTELHESAAKGSAYVGTERVPICRLDSMDLSCFDNSKKPFLKIDTQGFEWQVLDGASNIMPHIQGVLCELSLVPLYDGQRLWLDIIHRLETEGFTLWSLHRGFTDPSDGRTLQVDGCFLKV